MSNPFVPRWTPRELELLAEIGTITDEPGQSEIDAAQAEALRNATTYNDVLAIIGKARQQTGGKNDDHV